MIVKRSVKEEEEEEVKERENRKLATDCGHRLTVVLVRFEFSSEKVKKETKKSNKEEENEEDQF